MKLKFKSVQNIVDQINTAQQSYSDSVSKIPSYSEYNSEVITRMRDADLSNARKTLDKNFQAFENTIDVSITNLTTSIYKTKYPLMSRILEENMKLRGAMEYNNAVQLMALIAPKYPIKEIQVETFPIRYDFISTMVDQSLSRAYLAEQSTQEHMEFQKVANTVFEKWGVLDLMKEQLEFNWLKAELKVRYETMYSAGSDERMVWAIAGNENADKLVAQMNLLLNKNVLVK